MPGRTFPQDGRSATTESAPLDAMTRPAGTRDGHVPASGWRLRAPAFGLPRLPNEERGQPCAWGKEAMSYQPPPDYEAGTAVRNPPGWYLDPIGLQSLRWWDGAQWARNTQPLLEPAWGRPCPYPDAIASASGGYGAVRQPDALAPAAGRPARGTGYAPGLGARAIPSGRDAGAAGSRPASRSAGIAGPAVPRAGTAVSSAPRITAAEAP